MLGSTGRRRKRGSAAHADAQAEAGEGGAGQATAGLDRLLDHLDSYFLVAELVAGWRAGLLQALLEGPGTAAEVAGRAGAHQRSTAEWLALLCAAGLAGHDGGVFTAAPGLAGALDPDRLGFDLAVLLEMTEMWPRLMPALTRSLASGCGIPYDAYQPEFTGHVDRLRRPLNERYLVGDWLASVEGLPERLAAGGRGVGNQWGRDAVLADLAAAGFATVSPYDPPAGLTVYAAWRGSQ